MPGADRLGMGLSMSLLILSGDTTGSRVRRISPSNAFVPLAGHAA